MVVTGASSGIGYCTALKAQEQGWRVIWASRHIESDKQICAMCNENSECKNLDVSSEDSVRDFFRYVKSRYGKLDALVNCAGFVDPQSLLATSLENWEKTIKINLTGTFLCCKNAVQSMKKRGGKIINISSTAGLTPRPGWSAYAASKSGVISFSEAIAEELAMYNIKVFMICPGRTATPLRKILAPDADPMEGQPILVRERF